MTFRTLVVGVDGSPAAERALQWAALQVDTDGEILAVHVLTVSSEFWRDLPPSGFSTWRTRLGEQLEGTWTDTLRSARVPHRTVLLEDDSVDHGLLRVGAEHAADIIVLGAHGSGSLSDRLLGGATYKVAHRSTIPVVIVPADWRAPSS